MFRSKGGSIIYFQGEIYDFHWNLIYIPLNDAQAKQFIALVEGKEDIFRRCLNKLELDDCVKAMGD